MKEIQEEKLKNYWENLSTPKIIFLRFETDYIDDINLEMERL